MVDVKKVSWNTSQGLIMEISNRRSYANTFFVSGKIRQAFNTLIAIKQSVIQSFKKPEREDLEKLEKKFNKIAKFLYASSANSFNINQREAFSLAKSIAIKYYSEYNNKLMDLLNDRGYLIGEQTDASKMKFS